METNRVSLNEVLIELEEKGIQNDELQVDKAQRYLNITRDTGEFLQVLVRATRALKVLEVGTSNGYSTLWLASSLPENGQVTTIERLKNKAEEALSNFERANLQSKINLLLGNASQVVQELEDEYDLIFLDADRSQYMEISTDILRLLKEGGLLVCDNAVSHHHELADFIAYLKSQSNISTSLVPVGKGEFLAHMR